MKIAAIYVRVSTEDQSSNYSLPSQKDACLHLAQEKGFDVPEDYIITDGTTGTTLDRPGLKRLRELVDSRLIQAVICFDPDRLSRKLVHLMILTDEWQKKGIEVHFVLHTMESSPEGRLFFQMRGLFAEYEREKILERTSRGKRKRAQMGLVSFSKPPYGYHYIPGQGKLMIEEKEADVVRMIFRWFLEGENVGTRSIAKKLALLEIPTPGGKQRWWNLTVATILANATYGGMMFHNRIQWVESSKGTKGLKKVRPPEEWISVQVPAIVPKVWVETAREKLESHKHFTGHPKQFYLLSGMGILFCQCGKTMAGTWRGRKHWKYRYYRCGSQICFGFPAASCKTRPLNADMAERVTWAEIEKLLLNPEVVLHELQQREEEKEKEQEQIHQELKYVEDKLKHIQNERQELIEWGLQRIFGEKTRDIVKNEAQRLELQEKKLLYEKRELETRLQMKISKEDVVQIKELCQQFTCNLTQLKPEEKKKIVSLLVDRIVWDGNTLHIQLVVPETCSESVVKASPWP